MKTEGAWPINLVGWADTLPLAGPDPRLATTLTLLISHQLALLHVKLLFLHDFPFMKSAFAKGLPLVFLLQRRFFETNHVAHR